MKVKIDFVTNSSSTAYMIYNTSKVPKTLVDFALENISLVKAFKEQYDWYDDDPRFELGPFLESVARNNIDFEPGKGVYCVFGDEQGTSVGYVYDYMLRGGGHSKSFSWKFEESLR